MLKENNPHKWDGCYHVCKRCGMYKEEYMIVPFECITNHDDVLSFELGRLRRTVKQLFAKNNRRK